LAGTALAATVLAAATAVQALLSLPALFLSVVALLDIVFVVALALVTRPRPSDLAERAAIARSQALANGGEIEGAVRDPLTGLPTFQPFSERLLEEFHRMKLYGGSMALILFDVNDLEAINAEFGSAAGDAVLQHLARVLRAAKRVTDVLARMGDDEFGVLLLECDEEGARAFVERVQDVVTRLPLRVEVGGQTKTFWFGICAGVGLGHPRLESPDEIITAAVEDLNEAKTLLEQRRSAWQRSA
jgi:diguanylate cyclase (GGDEF)-like protein